MSRRDWALTIFIGSALAAIALIFRAPVAVAVFIFLAVLALSWAIFDPWLERQFWQRGPRTKEISTDSNRALRVTLVREDWSSFQHEARQLRLRVRIQNRTDSPLAWELAQLDGDLPFHHTKGNLNFGLIQERERLQRECQQPATSIPAHGMVEGCFVYELEYGSDTGEPGYRFRVQSSKGGHEYGFRRIANPKREIKT